jgi:tRNA pseudouridine38-40 synthase
MTGLRAAHFSRNPVPAGRTDAGVHARMQVLVMRVPEPVAAEDVAQRLDEVLPDDVGICLSRPAPPRFHPQWKAEAKEYRYRLALRDDAAWASFSWRVDVEPAAVLEVLRGAVGTRDFWAFHDKSSGRQPRTVRSVEGGEVDDGIYELVLRGDGFARYMVRYLVGGAVAVARKEVQAHDYQRALAEAVEFRGVRAPAQGLTLWDVRWPEGLDPFTAAERTAAAGLPPGPPFGAPGGGSRAGYESSN